MSDWSPVQSLSFVPTSRLVTFTALHQAALTQYVQIVDSDSNPISFTTLSGSSASFPISGQGTSVGFFNNGSGSFTMQPGYGIQFKNSGGNNSLVAASSPSLFYINGQDYGGGVLYVTEDQGGTDYNDTSFVLQWFTYEG